MTWGHPMLDPVVNEELEYKHPAGEPALALTRQPQGYEEIWLLGLPPLWRFLEFVKETHVDEARVDRAALTDEWRTANDYYQALEHTEAGIANEVQQSDLDPAFALHGARVMADARFRRTFNTLPTRLGMVELDRLIVYQKHVSRNFVDGLKARIGPAPDAETLFHICLPLGTPEAPVETRRVGPRRYVFRCPSTDFRFHEPALLRADQAQGYESFGAIAAIVGLVVGFGSNFLNIVSVGKRLLLNNGYHRVCALRELGVTRVPCVIQTATRGDELGICVKKEVADQAEFYFESARPPLLKDYFDPRIRKVLPVRRRMRQIEVDFDIKDFLVPE